MKTLLMRSNQFLMLVMFLLSFLLVASCDHNETNSNEGAGEQETVEPEISTDEINKTDIAGYYEKSAHDGAWFMTLSETKGIYNGKLVQFEGMLPPPDVLVGGEELEGLTKNLKVTNLIVQPEGSTFTSDLGSGSIHDGAITFDDIEDLGDKLTLSKVDF